MSEHMRKHHINKDISYKVIIEMPKKNISSFVPAKYLEKLEAFLEKYGESSGSIPWEDLAADDIKKYGKGGIALRGARYRERMSQKELAKRSGVSQENISKMENGKRRVGEKVAKKLAKILRIDAALLLL